MLRSCQAVGLYYFTPEMLEAAEADDDIELEGSAAVLFDDLVDGQVYTVEASNRAVIRAMRQEATHLGQGREDEFAQALLARARKDNCFQVCAPVLLRLGSIASGMTLQSRLPRLRTLLPRYSTGVATLLSRLPE